MMTLREHIEAIIPELREGIRDSTRNSLQDSQERWRRQVLRVLIGRLQAALRDDEDRLSSNAPKPSSPGETYTHNEIRKAEQRMRAESEAIATRVVKTLVEEEVSRQNARMPNPPEGVYDLIVEVVDKKMNSLNPFIRAEVAKATKSVDEQLRSYVRDRLKELGPNCPLCNFIGGHHFYLCPNFKS